MSDVLATTHELVIGSKNRDKVAEIAALLADLGVSVRSLAEFDPSVADVEETVTRLRMAGAPEHYLLEQLSTQMTRAIGVRHGPRDRMEAHGVTPEDVARGAAGQGLPEGWVPLMEELMGVADAGYDLAFQAIPALPTFFQRPVAVAARVYQGIHGEIRARGHDTLSGRAWTGLPTKLRLGAGALLELRGERRRHRARGARLTPLPLEPAPFSGPA